MTSGDNVVMPAQLAVGRGSLQQPALQTGAVHGGDGAPAGTWPHQALGRLAAEADAADVVGAQAAREARHLLRGLRALTTVQAQTLLSTFPNHTQDTYLLKSKCLARYYKSLSLREL